MKKNYLLPPLVVRETDTDLDGERHRMRGKKTIYAKHLSKREEMQQKREG